MHSHGFIFVFIGFALLWSSQVQSSQLQDEDPAHPQQCFDCNLGVWQPSGAVTVHGDGTLNKTCHKMHCRAMWLKTKTVMIYIHAGACPTPIHSSIPKSCQVKQDEKLAFPDCCPKIFGCGRRDERKIKYGSRTGE